MLRGLTNCNFSKRNPYLIVVSDYQGKIMIHDLRIKQLRIVPKLKIRILNTDVVWIHIWIERPNDKNEIIIMTSSDGKIKEWSLKKWL